MRCRPAVLLAVAMAGCGGGEDAARRARDVPEQIRLESPAFRAGSEIPRRFTCDGAEASPPLRWSGGPARPAELLLLMEDPDAPQGTFVHWVVAHIPGSARSIASGRVPAGAVQLEQSFGKRTYGGPCPPEDDPPHEYVFTLYALDRRLSVGDNASPAEVRSKLDGAVSARGRLGVAYGR